MSHLGHHIAEASGSRSGQSANEAVSSSFEAVSNRIPTMRLTAGSGSPSVLDTSDSSSLFPTANADASSMTSFDALDEIVRGHHPRDIQPAPFGTDAEMPATSDDMPSDATSSKAYVVGQESRIHAAHSLSKHPPMTLIALPIGILHQIFAITATRSYAARRMLPLVCRAFLGVTSTCPEMWDTFEIMTSNADALVSRKQVDYVLQKARSRPLSVGLGISVNSMESWKAMGEDEMANDSTEAGHPTDPNSDIRGVKLIAWVATIMDRIEDLILDIQDGDPDSEMEGAMLSLFTDKSTTHLRRLSLVGNYQLDRIVRLKTPSTHTSSLSLIPSFLALRSLSLSFTSSFSLPSELPQVTSLELSVISMDAHEGSSFHAFLQCFPNLITLAIHCLTGQSQRNPPAIFAHSSAKLPIITFRHLRRLILDGLPLTCPTLSYISTPTVYTLKLSDFDLGFDPRDIGYETTLAGYLSPKGDAQSLRPLPFGEFLAENSQWKTLRVLKLTKLPGVVARMCVDFTNIVGGRAGSELDGAIGEKDGGLTHLYLADFAWSDWEALLGGADSLANRTLDTKGKASPPASRAARQHPSSLPHLRALHIHLDHVSAWKTAGFMNGKHEDRQHWMDGLISFAEKRMSKMAVARMLRQFGVTAPSWLLEPATSKHSGEGSNPETLGTDDPARTVEYISLDTGFTDSLAFAHSAWLLLQRQHEETGAT